MEKKLGIIADDLTGANDSGVGLAEKGISTSVFFDLPKHAELLNSGIVIDTNSRALSKEHAFAVTKQAAQFLKDTGYPHIYKKMDSTLRGHIGTELQAVYEVFKPSFVVVAPAFPDLGRTTVDGVHYVNGKALEDTEAAWDPKHPVEESFIPRMIENEIGHKAGLLTQADMKKDLAAIQKILDQFQEKNIHFLVCDASSESDLKRAAEKILAVCNDVIWAGSAGLAEVLPEVLDMSDATRQDAIHDGEQVMTVCGSLSAVAQQQLTFAKKQPGISHIEVDTREIFSMNWMIISEEYKKKCLEAFGKGNDVVLYVPSDEEIRRDVLQIGKGLGLTSNKIGEYVSSALGEIVAAVAEENEKLTGLMLIGGDTAKDTTRCLGGIGFQLIKQVEAGIPLAKLIGTKREFTVVTKAGAFGKENSIYQAMQEMKGAK